MRHPLIITCMTSDQSTMCNQSIFLIKNFQRYLAWFWHCTSWTSGKFEKVMNISNLIHFSICFMVYAMCINEYNIDKCSVTYIMDDILGHILDFQKPYAISQEYCKQQLPLIKNMHLLFWVLFYCSHPILHLIHTFFKDFVAIIATVLLVTGDLPHSLQCTGSRSKVRFGTLVLLSPNRMTEESSGCTCALLVNFYLSKRNSLFQC